MEKTLIIIGFMLLYIAMYIIVINLLWLLIRFIWNSFANELWFNTIPYYIATLISIAFILLKQLLE